MDTEYITIKRKRGDDIVEWLKDERNQLSIEAVETFIKRIADSDDGQSIIQLLLYTVISDPNRNWNNTGGTFADALAKVILTNFAS